MKNSNKWLYTIKIKDDFEDETTPELIVKLCSILEYKLNKVKGSVEKSSLKEDEIDYICQELEETADNFTFLKHLADGTIPEDDWDDYSFYGDFEEDFNGYLSQLYDLADKRVTDKRGVTHKFLFLE